MNTCCPFFQTLIDAAGEPGLSALPVSAGGHRWFFLQMRAVKAGREHDLPKGVGGPNIRTVEQVAIQYCPRCGTKLATLIRDNEASFDEAARTARPFALGMHFFD